MRHMHRTNTSDCWAADDCLLCQIKRGYKIRFWLCVSLEEKKGKCGKSILYGGPKSHLREKIYKNYKLFISSSFSFVLLPSNLTQMLIHFISNIFKIKKKNDFLMKK